MVPMRVLIVNIGLVGRSGTEVVAMETAQGLRARGLDVRIYAPLVGPSGEGLRESGIIVTDSLEFGDWVPDVIQANQTNTLLAVVGRFPRVPVVAICHDSHVWYNEPIKLPQIRKYLAVDAVCRERVTSRTGIDEVEVLPNAVDLERFKRRSSLPQAPRRALVLTKQAGHVAQVIEACAQRGIALQVLGPGVGHEVDDLPERLRDTDLVFATARMSLEAMAVGCAVIVCDGRGLAGLVTADVARSWRPYNFGHTLLKKDISIDAMLAEIDRYDCRDAAAVSDYVRGEASLELYLDRLQAIYKEAASDSVPEPSPELMQLTEGLHHLAAGAETDVRRISADWTKLHTDYEALLDIIAEHKQHNSALEHTISEYKQHSNNLEASLANYKRLFSSLEGMNGRLAGALGLLRRVPGIGFAWRGLRSLSRALSRWRADP